MLTKTSKYIKPPPKLHDTDHGPNVADIVTRFIDLITRDTPLRILQSGLQMITVNGILPNNRFQNFISHLKLSIFVAHDTVFNFQPLGWVWVVWSDPGFEISRKFKKLWIFWGHFFWDNRVAIKYWVKLGRVKTAWSYRCLERKYFWRALQSFYHISAALYTRSCRLVLLKQILSIQWNLKDTVQVKYIGHRTFHCLD